MAQISMNAYDADVYIPEFRGLMQYGDQMGTDLRYSPDCMNVETPAGVLQPATLLGKITLRTSNGDLINYDENCSVMYLHAKYYGLQPYIGRTWYHRPGTPPGYEYSVQYPINTLEEYECLLFSIGNKLYTSVLPIGQGVGFGSEFSYEDMTGLQVNQLSGTFSGKHWSWSTYEKYLPGSAVWPDSMPDPPVSSLPSGNANILVLANETDGTYIFGGFGLFSEVTSAPAKFCNVARFAERIWGCGTGEDKDSIFYSRPYSATDWTGAGSDEDPSDGGGQIREPTFDNDKLVALVPFGDSLIAFSEQRAWRITGSDPSNFNIQEQYGNGTRYPRSIAVMNDRIIMLGEHGLVMYDGYRVTPFMKEATYEMFRLPQTGNKDSFAPVGIVAGSKYILSLGNKLGYSSHDVTDSGFRFLVYDNTDGTINIVDSPLVTDMCVMPPESWVMTALPPATSGEYAKVGISLLQFDSWDKKRPTSNGVKWVTPWVTFGRKDIQKGGFEVYFTPELADNAENSVTFKFSIQTEKKTKTKTYTVTPLSAEEIAAGKKYKQKRLHFGGTGRRFRFIIEVEAGNTVPWRLIGGIHIIAETDKD